MLRSVSLPEPTPQQNKALNSKSIQKRELGKKKMEENKTPKKRDALVHQTCPYKEINPTWPTKGRHILAQYTDEAVLVYQAYCPAIGHYAAANKKFVGAPGWQTRMTWVKTNFLWMMYRSGWGDKSKQEVTLGIWLKREFFEEMLAQAVHSTCVPEVYGDQDNWKKAVQNSEIRLQWDPDHTPNGQKETRRAIQLGIKGSMAEKFASGEYFVDVQDLSDFVAEQNPIANSNALEDLIVAKETVYKVEDEKVAAKLGVAEWNGSN